MDSFSADWRASLLVDIRQLPSGGAHLALGRPGMGQHRGELCGTIYLVQPSGVRVRGSFAMRPGALPGRPSGYSVR